MNDKDNKLHSIERSNLTGAGSRRRMRRPISNQPTLSRAVHTRKLKNKKRKVVFAVIILFIILSLISTTFSNAKIDITLARDEIVIDGVFSSIREPAQSKDISYARKGPYVDTKEESTTNITRERQNSRAAGTVTIYNINTSGERLDLVNRTRLESKSGRIYRIIGKQTIPGGKTVSGEFVPGQKEVKVEADEVGREYNIEEKGENFTVPGLKKYKEFSDTYATSETRIVGGFNGEKFVPNPKVESEIRKRLRNEIEKSLRNSLNEVLTTNTLSERIVFEGSIYIEYESLENEQVDNSVVLKERGTLYAISFREAELASLLSRFASPNTPDNVLPKRIDVTNIEMYMESGSNFDIVSDKDFSFRLSGSATLFWEVDNVVFLSDIADKNRSEVEDIILRKYSQITNINSISIFPIWKTKLPGNDDKIEVIKNHSLVSQ